MTGLCGHRGFAGRSASVLEKGHEGDHKYGDYQQALAIAAAKELQSLRDQLAAAQAERNELKALLKEGATGFGRILVATSDDAAVRDWQKRAKAAIAKGEKNG